MLRACLTSLLALLIVSPSSLARAENWGDTTQGLAASDGARLELPRIKFVLATSVTFTDTPISIDTVDLTPPSGTALADLVTDLEASIGEVTLKSTVYQVSASYFPLRFLQLTAKAGYVSSKSEADISVSGTFQENLLGLEGFQASLPLDEDNEGFTYGGGAALFLPIFKIADRPLVMRAGAEIGINNLGNIETQTLVTNLSVANAQRILDRDITLALGASYIQLDREVEYTAEIGGQETGVNLRQSLDSPWAASSTLLVPITESFGVSVTAANNFDGLQSYGLSLSLRR